MRHIHTFRQFQATSIAERRLCYSAGPDVPEPVMPDVKLESSAIVSGPSMDPSKKGSIRIIAAGDLAKVPGGMTSVEYDAAKKAALAKMDKSKVIDPASAMAPGAPDTAPRGPESALDKALKESEKMFAQADAMMKDPKKTIQAFALYAAAIVMLMKAVFKPEDATAAAGASPDKKETYTKPDKKWKADGPLKDRAHPTIVDDIDGAKKKEDTAKEDKKKQVDALKAKPDAGRTDADKKAIADGEAELKQMDEYRKDLDKEYQRRTDMIATGKPPMKLQANGTVLQIDYPETITNADAAFRKLLKESNLAETGFDIKGTGKPLFVTVPAEFWQDKSFTAIQKYVIPKLPEAAKTPLERALSDARTPVAEIENHLNGGKTAEAEAEVQKLDKILLSLDNETDRTALRTSLGLDKGVTIMLTSGRLHMLKFDPAINHVTLTAL